MFEQQGDFLHRSCHHLLNSFTPVQVYPLPQCASVIGRDHQASIPEGAGPGSRPAAGHLTTAVRPAPRRHITSAVKAVVIMPKPRPTLPIAHADDLPTIAFTDEEWQAIERAYPRQLNADVRQQITTVTTQYLKDCVFERTAPPKAMVRERLQRIRREVGDLEKVMRDGKPLSASTDELATEHQEDSKPLSASTDEPTEQQEDSKPLSASTDELSREQQEQQTVHSYADLLIRRYFNDPRLRLAAGWRGDQFRSVLTSLVVACDCALNDLSAAEGSGDQAWDWWIQALTRIVQRYDLPHGARIVETSGKPSPFVALVRAVQLVRALQEHVPARHMFSDGALAKAIQRAQARARDK